MNISPSLSVQEKRILSACTAASREAAIYGIAAGVDETLL